MDWKSGLFIGIWFLIGICIFQVFDKDWVALTAIGTWILTAGVVYAIIQIREMDRSRHAQIALDLFQEFHRGDKTSTLQKVYNLKSQISREEFEQKEYTDELQRILNQMDMLGMLIKHKIIDADFAIDGYAGATALRCWHQLHKCIEQERIDRRGKNYLENLQFLVTKTLEYANKKHRNEDWIMFQPGGEGNPKINLVKVMNQDYNIRPKNVPN